MDVSEARYTREGACLIFSRWIPACTGMTERETFVNALSIKRLSYT